MNELQRKETVWKGLFSFVYSLVRKLTHERKQRFAHFIASAGCCYAASETDKECLNCPLCWTFELGWTYMGYWLALWVFPLLARSISYILYGCYNYRPYNALWLQGDRPSAAVNWHRSVACQFSPAADLAEAERFFLCKLYGVFWNSLWIKNTNFIPADYIIIYKPQTVRL